MKTKSFPWVAAAVVLFGAAAVIDATNGADKVLRLISRASYELNALNTAAGAIQHLAAAVLCLAGARWLWSRRDP